MDCKPAHCGRRKAGHHSNKTLPATPPCAIWPLVTEHAESLNHANTFIWSWHEPTGNHLAAAAAEHDGASLAGYLHTLPAQQLIEKSLSACQAIVTQPLHYMHQKHFATCGHLQGIYPPKGGDHKLGQCTCPSQGMFLSAA